MNKKTRLIMRTIILIAIVAAIGYTLYQMFTEKNVVEVGEEAPNFVLENLDGERMELKDFRGKGVLLNFWATWCDPCKEEMPYLNQAYKEYKDQGVVVVAVNIAESKLAVQTFADRYNLIFPILMDKKRKITGLYNIGPIPTTFVINAKGVVVDKVVGSMPDIAYVKKMMDKVEPK